MPRDDAVDLHGDGSAEGHKFKLIESSAVSANHGYVNMRIGSRIAMAREMFGRCRTAVFLHAANELGHKLRDALRIFAERSRVEIGFPGLLFTSASGA